MKTVRLFAILVLLLSANILFADNDPYYLTNKTKGTTQAVVTVTLVPVAPKEADFEEIDLSCNIPIPAAFFRKVSPSLPRYAEFDDDILPVHVGKLIPAIPSGGK